MKLHEFDFNQLKRPGRPTNLAIHVKQDGKLVREYMKSTIGETLKSLPLELANAEILSTRWFFDTFVIEIAEPET